MASRTVFRFLVLLAALVWILDADNSTRRWREPWTNGSWFNMGLQDFEKWTNQTNLFSESSRICAKIRGLTPGQRRICRRHKDHMQPIGQGVKQGINECQYQFKGRRWNCTTTGDETVFGPLTLIASPETAFTHAITAAAASLYIARACRDGRLSSCGCSRSHRPKNLHSDWVWAGCGVDLEYGYRSESDYYKEQVEKKPKKHTTKRTAAAALESDSSDYEQPRDTSPPPKRTKASVKKLPPTNKETKRAPKVSAEEIEHSDDEGPQATRFTEGFVDIRERERKVKRGSREQGRQLMNRHNNEAGRRAVIKKSRVTCKCHGVSGSCSLITCWQQLASLREIGDYLRDKYEGATEVKVSRRGKLRLSDTHYSIPTAQDLVYLEESPNYCVRNDTIGSKGTSGRECNRTSSGMDGCSLMCCGRGYNTKRRVVRERCRCKFHWCCRVECDTCMRTEEIYTCK